VVDGCININELFSLEVDMPKNKQLTPVIDIIAYHHTLHQDQKSIFGLG